MSSHPVTDSAAGTTIPALVGAPEAFEPVAGHRKGGYRRVGAGQRLALAAAVERAAEHRRASRASHELIGDGPAGGPVNDPDHRHALIGRAAVDHDR